MIIEPLPADARVDNGVRLLDRYGPANWRSQIDPAVLDIDSSAACVVGQLYGDWEVGQAELELHDAEDAEFFGLYPAEDGDAANLTASWRALLLGHRYAALPPRIPAARDVQTWQCGAQAADDTPPTAHCTAPKKRNDDRCPEHARDLAHT
ncbi:hypothetical protein [Streptomyces californicus]|uniref:hypothetical protein n=1 Tax=Streptomyces californicus TaxID=67351 RepID=UPI003719ADA4